MATAHHVLFDPEKIKAALQRTSVSSSDANDGKKSIASAVLVPIVLRQPEPTVLLTKRTDHLHDHPGQISFPGGRVEPQDDSSQATALRETEEEIGLSSKHIEVLGFLPDYLTGTGFCIAPVVALVHPPFSLQLDAFEVAEVIEVPWSFLLNPENYKQHAIQHQGIERQYYAIDYNEHLIWGATAGIIRILLSHIESPGLS